MAGRKLQLMKKVKEIWGRKKNLNERINEKAEEAKKYPGKRKNDRKGKSVQTSREEYENTVYPYDDLDSMDGVSMVEKRHYKKRKDRKAAKDKRKEKGRVRRGDVTVNKKSGGSVKKKRVAQQTGWGKARKPSC